MLRESFLVSSSCFVRCLFSGGQSVNISLLFILINVHKHSWTAKKRVFLASRNGENQLQIPCYFFLFSKAFTVHFLFVVRPINAWLVAFQRLSKWKHNGPRKSFYIFYFIIPNRFALRQEFLFSKPLDSLRLSRRWIFYFFEKAEMKITKIIIFRLSFSRFSLVCCFWNKPQIYTQQRSGGVGVVSHAHTEASLKWNETD